MHITTQQKRNSAASTTIMRTNPIPHPNPQPTIHVESATESEEKPSVDEASGKRRSRSPPVPRTTTKKCTEQRRKGRGQERQRTKRCTQKKRKPIIVFVNILRFAWERIHPC